MKKLITLLAFITLSLGINAQASKITGSWLMTKAETPNGVKSPYFITEYTKDGKMVIMDMEAGTWKYDKKQHAIVMESELDKDFNGVGKILELSADKMIIEKNGAKLYYSKVNPEKTLIDNEASGLYGNWEAKTPDGGIKALKFEAPDLFAFTESSGGMTETSRGTWAFNPEDETLLILGFWYAFRGLNKVTNRAHDSLVLNHEGNSLAFTRVIEGENKIERLSFTYEDFPEEWGNDGELPWADFELMVDVLGTVDYLSYKYGELVEEAEMLKYSTLISKLAVNQDEKTVMFTNIIIENGDSSQYSQNYKGGLTERYNDFFPKEEPAPYRIAGFETITVPAGTFECTVIEGLDGEEKIKMWMINDTPGVYAKIIKEGEDVWGDLSYSITELEEIGYK